MSLCQFSKEPSFLLSVLWFLPSSKVQLKFSSFLGHSLINPAHKDVPEPWNPIRFSLHLPWLSAMLLYSIVGTELLAMMRCGIKCGSSFVQNRTYLLLPRGDTGLDKQGSLGALWRGVQKTKWFLLPCNLSCSSGPQSHLLPPVSHPITDLSSGQWSQWQWLYQKVCTTSRRLGVFHSLTLTRALR